MYDLGLLTSTKVSFERVRYRLVQFIQAFQFLIAVDAVMAINDEPFMIKDI